MKRIFVGISVLTIILFSVSTVFSKPNPNSTTAISRPQYQSQAVNSSTAATPQLVKARLEALECEIEMPYSALVQSKIDSFFKHGRKQLSSLLGRAAYYMPIFEEELRKAGLPEELKYVAVLESQLEAKAKSGRGAGGFWQFMPIAAKGYDMVISSTIDERCDPYISSERACRLLKDLYNKFGDWHLVLAAYNAGPGTVQRAIKRAGGVKSYEAVVNYLPAQTRKYVPTFVAFTYIMNYYAEHNVAEGPMHIGIPTDTVHISKKESLRSIANSLDVSVERLRDLNPHLRSDLIPASGKRHCNLILPADCAREYKEKESLVIADNI